MMTRKSLLISVLLMASIASSWCATIEVIQSDPNAPYQKIGDAIKAAKVGDTILVHPGLYVEDNLRITGIVLKSTRGPEVTIIQSPSTSNSDGITMKVGSGDTLPSGVITSVIGFSVQGFKIGIMVDSVSDVLVANNILTSNTDNGIHMNKIVPTTVKIWNNVSVFNGNCGLGNDRYERVFTSISNNIFCWNGTYGSVGDRNTFGDYNIYFENQKGVTAGYNIDIGLNSLKTNPLISKERHFRISNENSPIINAGHPGDAFKDPDGSRNDIGAYGGPFAKDWWRDPFTGPSITNVIIDPPQVRPGESFTIRVTAKTYD